MTSVTCLTVKNCVRVVTDFLTRFETYKRNDAAASIDRMAKTIFHIEGFLLKILSEKIVMRRTVQKNNTLKIIRMIPFLFV